MFKKVNGVKYLGTEGVYCRMLEVAAVMIVGLVSSRVASYRHFVLSTSCLLNFDLAFFSSVVHCCESI